MGIGRKQPNVLVQIECAAERKIQTLFFVEMDKLPIHAFHGLTRGQAEHQMRISPEIMGDDSRDERGGRFVAGLDDNFHESKSENRNLESE